MRGDGGGETVEIKNNVLEEINEERDEEDKVGDI